MFRILPRIVCICLLATVCLPLRAGQVVVPVKGSPVGNAITALLQDDDGFIWIGTVSGLMRYDMYAYRYFGDCDSMSLSRTMIRCLTRDAKGNIWVGSDAGAAVYDVSQERFHALDGRIASLPVKTIVRASDTTMLLTTGEGVAVVDMRTLIYNYIPCEGQEHLKNMLTTTSDAQGRIWGWSHGRLSRFDFSADPLSPRIESWPFDYEVRAMTFDAHGRLWFNDRSRLMTVTPPAGDEKSPPRFTPQLIKRDLEVRSILISDDSVLVTSAYDGIHRFRIAGNGDITAGGVSWIAPETRNEVCNSVICAMPDRCGNTWFGTVDGIYVCYTKPRELFRNMSAGAFGMLSHNVVSDVCCGPSGAVWAATSGGLDCIRADASGAYQVEHFRPWQPDKLSERDQTRLQTLEFDKTGLLWLGTKRNMLFFDTQARRFVEKRNVTTFLSRYGAHFSKELMCDNKGNIWMGFIYGGLFVYDAAGEQCRTVLFGKTDLFDASIQAILEDAEGYLWLGTKTKGLLRFHPRDMLLRDDTAVVSRYECYFSQEHTVGFNSINALYRTPQGDVYAGTSDGLFRWAATEKTFRKCPLGLNEDEIGILDIIGDGDGKLWVTTGQGLYCFDGTSQAPFYEIADGAFTRSDYNFGSCIDARGVIFMGGISGVTYFNPQEIEPVGRSPRVWISRVSVLNRDIVPDGKHLDANINRSRRLTLNYDDYQLSLDFTTLEFSPDQHVGYYYKIEGLHTDWISLGEGNRLSFSNLAHGEYVLHVKASDASGVLSDYSTDILIRVLPPWWLTWWSYCIYAVLALLLAAAVVWVILIRYRAAQKVRMVQYKQQLFINLTHGLKTPLTMMQVPLQLMTGDAGELSDEERRGLLAMLGANVRKLANTIRQLMEFRKIDQNKVALNLAEIDIVEYVRQICDYFTALFRQKGLVFSWELPEEQILVTVDPEKIELALYNLLQNAYTFTLHGEVKVLLRRSGAEIEIVVRDTGVGIRTEDQPKIFHRFWQVHQSDTMPPLGAGIGLAVAKEFVELHGGQISVESRSGEGSAFTIRLPLTPTRLGAGEYYVHKSDLSDEERIMPVYTKQFADTELYAASEPAIDDSKPNTVYVVAGGGDVAGLMRMVLVDYNVLHFNNVEEAFRAVHERPPQLMLIDIVVYDRAEGLALCRRLKGSKQTNDIPVVLLTADNSPEDARLFCELGVDSYMEKPFDVELFRARVRQLVGRQAEMRQKLKIEQILNKRDDIVVESADEKFMSRVTEIIEKHLSDEEFTLNEFAAQMRVSRSVLNMRIQSIAGKSPMELLRNARMQRAAQLLATAAYDIAQVSYMVGFSDPRYFSTSFKKQFGESPRAWMLRNRKA